MNNQTQEEYDFVFKSFVFVGIKQRIYDLIDSINKANLDIIDIKNGTMLYIRKQKKIKTYEKDLAIVLKVYEFNEKHNEGRVSESRYNL